MLSSPINLIDTIYVIIMGFINVFINEKVKLCNLEFNQLRKSRQFYCMQNQSRSLYVDDIPGAQPKRHVYLKKSYRDKHDQEILRFARKNPQEKRMIDWYVAPRKSIEPIDRDDEDQWKTKRSLLHDVTTMRNLSKSLILSKSSLSSTEQPGIKSQSSNVLKQSAKSSLSSVNKSEQNPYFPHMYVDPKMGQSNKWSGEKFWQDEPTRLIELPTIDQCYFKKWF